MLSKPPADNPHNPDELAQLPHGRHGLPQDFVERNQRERLLASFTALVGEVGYSGATITATTEGAGISSRTFYKYFETIEDCCAAAFDRGLEELRPIIADARRSASDWPGQVHAVLAAVLADFAGYPELARLLTVEPFVAGPLVAKRHKAAVEEIVPLLRQGRELREAGYPLPDTTERGLVGAANSMIGRHVLAQGGDGLDALLPDLAQFILTPYLGATEARRYSEP